MNASTKTGLLLINLGTPKSPKISDVRRYLREFLSDPRVIDIPAAARWTLLNTVILPFRPRQSASAYQKIWTEQGSPLLVYSQQLKNALADQLGGAYVVTLGMRYGEPSIPSAIQSLLAQSCHSIIVFPLFPQYSSAATGSAIQETLTILSTQNNIPDIKVCVDFYDHPAFIRASAAVIRETINETVPDYLLFSYHGLTERQIVKTQCKHFHACKKPTPCPSLQQTKQCYRGQCYTSSRLIAAELGMTSDQYGVAFQSRLGRIPWIQPYTDRLLPELRTQGVKKLAIACPSFVADCLETLEEIGIRAKEQWLALGGDNLQLIPCLNAKPVWVDALSRIIQEQEALTS